MFDNPREQVVKDLRRFSALVALRGISAAYAVRGGGECGKKSEDK